MKELEDCNLQLLEQPFPRWDLKGMAKLHPAASMQILPLACEFTEFFQVKGSILKQKLEIENGCLKVPQGIGFGVDLDEEALSNHLKSNCSYYNLLKSYIIIRLVPVLLNISGLRRKTIEINAWEEKFPLEKPLPIRLFN